MKPARLLLVFSLLFIISSCANYKLNYTKEVENWEQNAPDPSLSIAHSMFLIGDAGGVPSGEEGPALKLLKTKLKAAGEKSSVLFLGDNIYSDGLAPKSETAERQEDESRLISQLEALDEYPGRPFFIPGNHDWYTYGLDGVKRQKKFIEEYLDRKNVFYPDPGCGGPEEIEINDDLVLVIIDSQWFLSNWDGETEINNGCDAQSREVFKLLFNDAIKGNRSKNIVVAMHHPLYTNGPHGGQFTFREHLFPLTELVDNLYIPLPIIGSIYPILRASAATRQDISHPRYKEMKAALIGPARANGSFIFVAGHEHNLQYAQNDEQHFIVSGGGSKVRATNIGRGASFAYGHRGFSQIDFYEDGSAWTTFWAPNEDGSEGKIVFRKKIRGPLDRITDEAPESFSPMPEFVEIPISENEFSRSKFGQWLWGAHYRDSYNQIIKIPTLDLSKFKGGVEPVKTGGGMQTRSLRLEDSSGKQYTMRGMDKDATRTLPYPFTESFALNIIKDNFSASHPLGATAVPKLADAAGIYHANPAIYYIPRQPALGRFNDDFGDALYMVEERPDDEHWGDFSNFGSSDNIVSTPDLIEEMLDDHEDLVDYKMVARHRVFDLFLGDWDRHDDQWRWAQKEVGNKKLYQPIPRDRDQAFANYDGFLLSIARTTLPFGRQLREFRSDKQKLKHISYNSRHFDKTFLNGAEWQDWEAAVKEIQASVTDEVIESAFKDSWPEPMYELDGPKLIKIMKERRDKLMEYARGHYLHLAEKVDVVGTNQRDLFTVERLDAQRTRVRIFDTNKEAEREDLLFERTFLSTETKEISIYGLDDEDIFRVVGEAPQGIKVRLIGGLGKDTFEDESKVALSKNTFIYDASAEDNVVKPGKEARVRLSNNPSLNSYNRRSIDYEYDYGFFLPSASFNPDDGILIGALGQIVSYGFKQSPYASRHSISANYAIKTSGSNLKYSGEFIDVFRPWDILLEAHLQTPLYTTNFYGLGNDTENPEISIDEDLDFNQVRQRIFSFTPAIMQKLEGESFFAFGPTFESFSIEQTEGRFIDQPESVTGVDPAVFDGLNFVGARFILDAGNQDHPALPTRGVGFFSELGWKTQLDASNQSFGYLKTSFTAYLPLGVTGNTVLATRLGFYHNFNDKYPFFQGATLGGIGPRSNMRGLRRDRFNGQTAFYQNIDLRIRLFSSGNNVVPFTLGIVGGFDHGRVWLPGEESDTWHASYGGGLWLSPFDMIVFNIGMYRGADDKALLNFGGSFFF